MKKKPKPSIYSFPPPQYSKPKEETWRKLFFKGIINNLAALIIAPVTLYIGVRIGRFFQLPRPEIESVSPNWQFNNGPWYIDSETVSMLANNQLFLSRLEQHLPEDDARYVNWIDGKEPVNYDFINRIRIKISEQLNQMAAEGKQLEFNVRQLKDYVPGSPLPDLVPTQQVDMNTVQQISELHAINRNGKGPIDISGMFRSALQRTRLDIDLCTALLNQIDKIKGLYDDDNNSIFTGVEFDVGILNKGESDAVVYKDGSYLQYKSNKLTLTLDSFYVVKAHSFRYVTYTIDDSKADSATLSSLRKYLNDTTNPGQYTIFSKIDNKIYHRE